MLASSTYVGFYEGRRQFIYKVFTCKKIRRNKEKLFTRVHAEYNRIQEV